MRSETCIHCSDKDWNCPHPYCSMSSSRHWNVIRHIGRRHDGLGVPFNQNDFTSKPYKESANRERSQPLSAIASSLAAVSLSSAQKQQKNIDPFDYILPRLRKTAELKNLLSQLSTRSQGNPVFASSYGFTHAACRLSNAFSNLPYPQPFCFNDDEIEIVGYRGYACGSCLINHPLAIYTPKQPALGQQKQQRQLLQIIPTSHQCDSQRLIRCSSLPTETKHEIIANLYSSLPETIMKTVNAWTKNRSCLLSIEIPYNIQKGCCIDLFPKHENHWSIRTSKKRQTAFINAEEVKDFICSANNATFGLFNVHLPSKQMDSKSTYFLFVSPIDPQEP